MDDPTDEIERTICELVAEKLELSPGAITATTNLRALPDVDSLGILELMFELERRFGIGIHSRELVRAFTARDLATVVRSSGTANKSQHKRESP
jgi:acyl carrier protein